MKKFLSVIAWIVGVPLAVVLVFVGLGASAVLFDFWPPDCSILPKLEPRRVCEFSKLNKVPKGKPATVTFWVTVPANTPAKDRVFLAIDGRESVEMERTSASSFEKVIGATTGDTLSYAYWRNDRSSVSSGKTHAVKSLEKNVYDAVSAWSDIPAPSLARPDMVRGVDMKDTWTINYNMNLFEDTRRNIDASMDRVKAMGASEFGVFSFIDMSGKKDDFTVVETASPYYHWRDAAITFGEMKTLVKKAKARDLKVVLHYNVGADYNQYYNVSPIGAFTGGQAGSGIGGNAAEGRAGKDLGRDEPKTKAWLDRYFTQLDAILVKWAGDAERAGIDAIDITPQYRPPPAAPELAYADEKYREIIRNMRKVYRGKIYGSNFGAYGGFSYGAIPAYANDLDRLYIHVARIDVRPGASIAEMRQAHAAWLDNVEATFKKYGKPVVLVIGESSYDGTTSGKPGREWGDWSEVLAAGYKENWQEQADSYEAFLEALAGRSAFAGVTSGLYWWDDLMAPKYMGTLNNMEGTIRNKPAEAVWKKWLAP